MIRISKLFPKKSKFGNQPLSLILRGLGKLATDFPECPGIGRFELAIFENTIATLPTENEWELVFCSLEAFV